MQRIIAPLQIGDSSPAVANLQDALQLFLDLVSSSNSEVLRGAKVLLIIQTQDI
jgi:hypothetical protein